MLVLKADIDNLNDAIPEAEACTVLVQPCTYREVDQQLMRMTGMESGASEEAEEAEEGKEDANTGELFARLHPQKILVAEDVEVNQILIKGVPEANWVTRRHSLTMA